MGKLFSFFFLSNLFFLILSLIFHTHRRQLPTFLGWLLVVSWWLENVGNWLTQLSDVDNRLGFFKIDYRCHFRILTYPLPIRFRFAFYIVTKMSSNLFFEYSCWILMSKIFSKLKRPALVGSVLLIVLVICVVLLCVFTFRVPCCDVSYDFRIKTMFDSFLPPVVHRDLLRAHVIFKWEIHWQ